MSIGHRLPHYLSSRLFGDRRRFGLRPKEDDPCWLQWTEDAYLEFYNATQKRSVGKIVNDAGYRVLREVDLSAKAVLEIGPGSMPHLAFWRGRPARFVIADIQQQMLDLSMARLGAKGLSGEPVLLSRKEQPGLPFEQDEFDVIISFYSFEHMHPFDRYFRETLRCLKPGGLLVGAIPAEGGLAWGLGRFLTSRRWLLRNTNINPDKLICWEHPTWAEDILNTARRRLEQVHLSFYPLRVPLLDVNLVVRFVFRKPRAGAGGGAR